MRKTALALMSVLLLAGCGGNGPSEAEMKNAIESVFKSNPITAAMFPGFEKFQKLECKPVESEKGYNCSFRATATVMGHTETKEDSALFIHGDKGWTVRM